MRDLPGGDGRDHGGVAAVRAPVPQGLRPRVAAAPRHLPHVRPHALPGCPPLLWIFRLAVREDRGLRCYLAYHLGSELALPMLRSISH